MSAADEIAKLEARVASLRSDLDEATRVIGQQSLVLASHRERLDKIEAGKPEPPPVPAPEPVPPPAEPPPAPAPEPVPPPVPTPTRTVEVVTAWINEEVAKVTTQILNASQMNAWLNGNPKFSGFMSADWTARSEADNRAQMKKFIEKDVVRFGWPPPGGTPPSPTPAPVPEPPPDTLPDTFHIIVSGEAS